MAISADHTPPFKLVTVEDYEPLVGAETVERILRKASRLRDLHVAHVNSTFYGGGVAELLSSVTLLMNSAGIKTGWRVIQGRPDFFSVTKKMHNARRGYQSDRLEAEHLRGGRVRKCGPQSSRP